MIDSPPDDVAGSAPGDAPGNVEAQPLSVGAALREARTRLGMSVAEVAQHLKFAPRQIESLEGDDFAHLPEMAFVRGFVRSYARLLQLDPVPLLAALPGATAQPAPPAPATLAEVPFPSTYSTRKPNILWLVAALAVAVALALFTWLHGNAPSAPKEEPHVETLALPAALPVSAVTDAETMKEPQAVAPKVQQADAIRLVFDAESWVEVTDKDGKVLLSQLNPRGTEQSINGKPPFSVVIGHAGGVRLYYNGQAVDLAQHTKAEVAHLTLE